MPFYKTNRYMNEDNGDGNQNGGGVDVTSDKDTATGNQNNGGSQNSQPSQKEAELLKEVMSKKQTITEQNATISKLQEQLKAFEGIDPEAVKAMIAEQKEKADKELERKGEFDRLKAQMIEEHQKKVSSLEESINAIREELNSAKNQNAELTVGNAFSNSMFIKNETVLTSAKTRKLYGDYFAYEDGRVVGYDKPAGSKERTILVDGMGNPLSFDEALKKVIEADPEKDTILKSKAKPGAGSGTRTNTKPANPQKSLTSAEKIAIGLQKQKQGKL